MGQYTNCGDIFGLRALVAGPRSYVEPYKPFSGMSTSRLVRKLVDGGAWEVAKEVLVYRRYHDAGGAITDIAGLQKDLDAPFKMEWEDARKLCDYEELFNDCMRIAVSSQPLTGPSYICPKSQAATNSYLQSQKLGNPQPLPPALQAVLPPPTAALPTLSLFFASWLLAYRFGYDSVRAFSRRNPLTLQQLADFHLHARLMTASRHFKRHVCWPQWSRAFDTLYPDLLLLWGHDLQNCDWLMTKKVMAGGNALLRHKVFFHLAAVGVEGEGWESGQVRGWMGLRRGWERDRADTGVGTLLGKYEKYCDLGRKKFEYFVVLTPRDRAV